MADELHCEQDLQPLLVVNDPPNARSWGQSKAKFMCDHNFAESHRQKLRKIEEILKSRDVAALMAQDPYILFWTVYKTGRLPKVSPHENEALEKTAIWFTKHFAEFAPKEQDLMDCLVTWIRAQLLQRLKDLRYRKMGEDDNFYYHDCEVIDSTTKQQKTVRVRRNLGEGVIAGEDGEIMTLLDLIDADHQINLPKSRSAIHRSLADKPTKAVYADVMEVIENDPEGKLRETSLENNPAVNAYEVLYRMHIKDESLADICRDLGINHASVNTMVQERAYLYLAQYALNHLEGYEPETLRQVVEANPNGILTKFKAAMRDQNDKRCPEANVQYFAKQFCSCFGEVRSSADVTLELTTNYQYQITAAMVKEFWRTTGAEKLAKAVRLFNVNKHSPKNDDAP